MKARGYLITAEPEASRLRDLHRVAGDYADGRATLADVGRAAEAYAIAEGGLAVLGVTAARVAELVALAVAHRPTVRP